MGKKSSESTGRRMQSLFLHDKTYAHQPHTKNMVRINTRCDPPFFGPHKQPFPAPGFFGNRRQRGRDADRTTNTATAATPRYEDADKTKSAYGTACTCRGACCLLVWSVDSELTSVQGLPQSIFYFLFFCLSLSYLLFPSYSEEGLGFRLSF